jgi:hypothetical protein
MDKVQVRRSQSLEGVAPRTDPRSVTVLGNALGDLVGVFGTPASGRGVRRLFVNNINAGFSPADYDHLADQLRQVMGSHGQVEVQWDMSPELPGNPGPMGQPGSRHHIRGDLLRAALERRGIAVGYSEGSGIAYPYTVTPSSTAGGTNRPAGQIPPPPNPAASGRRAVITFP